MRQTQELVPVRGWRFESFPRHQTDCIQILYFLVSSYTRNMIRTNASIFIQIIGWLGVVLILGSYTALTFGLTSAASAWYQLTNLLGAIGIIIETAIRRDPQPMVLNIIWAIVALIGLLTVLTI